MLFFLLLCLGCVHCTLSPLANYSCSRWPTKWANILFMGRKIHFSGLCRDQVTQLHNLTLCQLHLISSFIPFRAPNIKIHHAEFSSPWCFRMQRAAGPSQKESRSKSQRPVNTWIRSLGSRGSACETNKHLAFDYLILRFWNSLKTCTHPSSQNVKKKSKLTVADY